jgi:hypothetical protein
MVPTSRSGPCAVTRAGPPARTLFENCIASTSIFVLPSYKGPTVNALASTTDEDVSGCDKPRGAA